MRWCLLVLSSLALAGCHGGGDRGPAWPKSAGTVTPDSYLDDGGESLEPRASHLAGIEISNDDTAAGTADASTAPTPADATAPDAATPTPTETPLGPTMETIEIQLENLEVGPGAVIINGS